MNRDQIIDYLWQRWTIVVQFFNELYPLVAGIMPQFYNILSQQINAAVSNIYAVILNYVNARVAQLQGQITALSAQVTYLVQSAIATSQAFTLTQVNNLRAYVIGYFDYLTGYIQQSVARLDVMITIVQKQTEFSIEKLRSEILARLGLLENTLNKLIHVAHFDNIEALQFLGYFLKYPYQVIGDILLEIIFSLIFHEIGRALVEQDEIETPRPEFREIPGFPHENR
jgi:hypothetical protein